MKVQVDTKSSLCFLQFLFLSVIPIDFHERSPKLLSLIKTFMVEIWKVTFLFPIVTRFHVSF